jgi:hypothetical protein
MNKEMRLRAENEELRRRNEELGKEIDRQAKIIIQQNKRIGYYLSGLGILSALVIIDLFI